MDFLLNLLTYPTILAAIVVVMGLIYSHVTGRPLIVMYPDPSKRTDNHTDESVQEFVTIDSIQGQWRMVSVGRNGNFAPQEVIDESNLVMSISGNEFELSDSGSSGTLKLRNNVLPTHMDQLDDDGDIHLCIVRFRNAELEICQGEVGKKRPMHFSEVRFDGASLTRFKSIDSAKE